jgi:RHS repeat-associated protein
MRLWITPISDVAYAPYGEDYADSGGYLQFTEGNLGQLTVTGTGGQGLFDFDFRKYRPAHGRWISPDPAGLAAVDPSDPQSWNRYDYVANNPVSFIDPLGLRARRRGPPAPKGLREGTPCVSTWVNPFAMSGGCNNWNPFDFVTYSWTGENYWLDFNGFFFLANSRGGTGSGNVNFGLAANNVSKQFPLTTPCGSSASQVMGAVEGNFAQFGNYSRWGGLESVTFSPPSGMGPGSTIPISVSVFGFTQNLSVNVQSMNSQSMTFTTNPGHLLYPASITFASSPASPGSINFNINLGGTVANPTEFRFGGSAFEDAQWNHFLGQVSGFCKVGH